MPITSVRGVFLHCDCFEKPEPASLLPTSRSRVSQNPLSHSSANKTHTRSANKKAQTQQAAHPFYRKFKDSHLEAAEEKPLPKAIVFLRSALNQVLDNTK